MPSCRRDNYQPSFLSQTLINYIVIVIVTIIIITIVILFYLVYLCIYYIHTYHKLHLTLTLDEDNLFPRPSYTDVDRP
jgi:hypothetical protein